MSATFPIAFGRYQLVERLAVGGMAELFLADVQGEHGFAKRVVIKRILPQLAADPRFKAMFIAEAKITARLIHPKIAQTNRLGHQGGALYIEMEYVDGLDVLAMLRECAYRRVRLPAEVSVHIMSEVLEGLDFAHRLTDEAGRPLHVVHRDVSPSNVLVSRGGNVKLVDFGIAQAALAEQQTRAGTLKGKYGYMSPEQVAGAGVTAASDLFAVGVVLAEMLMGRRLFAAPNELDVLLMVRDVNLSRLERFGAQVPAELDAILRRALSKDPAGRFSSAADMRDALDEWLFQSRLRVNAARIGELVESLYEDAQARRLASLDEAVVGPVAGVPVSAVAGELSGRVRETPRAAAGTPEMEIHGIPVGHSAVLGGHEALSEVEIELAMPSGSNRDRPASEPAPAEPGEAPGTAPRGRGGAAPAPEGMDARDGADGIPISIEDQDTHPVPVRGGPRELVARVAVVEQPSDEQPVRYPSIRDAVASVSPTERDPSARDFDDSGVPGLVGDDIRSGRFQLPSPDELARAPRPAPPPLDEIADPPGEVGDLAKTSPIRVLFQLVTSRADGLLVVSVGGIRKEIYMRGGVPTYVSSNVAGELFGAYLVNEGAVSSGELDMALAMMPHFGGKLGDTLVGLGLMKPLDVFRLLTRQVRHKLVDICTWSKGTSTWYPGRQNRREAFPLDLDAYEVLGAGALALPDDFLWTWSGSVQAARPRAAERAPVRPEQLKIGRIGRDVLQMLDGRATVSELIASRPGPEERLQLLRVLFLFLETGLASSG